MELKFFSIDEVKDFVKQLKGQRGKNKDEGDEGGEISGGPASGSTVPPPLQPPANGPGPTAAGVPQQGFNPTASAPQQGFNPAAGFAASAVDPAVQGLVNRIVPRIDAAIAAGQPADTVLTWFRGQCGQEAASATMDQIKTVHLAKLSVPQLTQIAGLMGA